jgi:elongation factor 1-beta
MSAYKHNVVQRCITMAQAVVTVKIMPVSPEVDLDQVQGQVVQAITGFVGEGEKRVAIEPIAFGLKAINVTFVMDEALGGPDQLEEAILAIEGVNSFEVVDVRRAIG